MEFAEIWDKISGIVISCVSSISVSTVIACVLSFINTARHNKMVKQLQQLSQLQTDKGLEKIKTITYKHDIQPLVESELKKVNEYSVEVLKKESLEVKQGYASIIKILEKLSHYFDNAYGVNEEAKAELQNEIDNAKNGYTPTEPAETKVIIEEHTEEKETTTTAKSTKAVR